MSLKLETTTFLLQSLYFELRFKFPFIIFFIAFMYNSNEIKIKIGIITIITHF